MPKYRDGRLGKGGQQKMTEPSEGVSRPPAADRRGLARAIWELALIVEGFCDAGPDARRIDLRDFRRSLERKHSIGVTETDVAQDCAEEDGEELENTRRTR